MLLNAVPGLRALDWRLVASANLLYGSLSATNRNLLPPNDLQGNPLTRAQSLGALLSGQTLEFAFDSRAEQSLVFDQLLGIMSLGARCNTKCLQAKSLQNKGA